MAVCPRTGAKIHHLGKHLLADLYGASHLTDVAYIQAACEEAALATGATIIGSNFHHFGEGCGVSGVVLLAESHVSIHTWSEWGIATLDIYVCGDCDPKLAIPVLKDKFTPYQSRISMHRRGSMMFKLWCFLTRMFRSLKPTK